jgi:hypothetical protein
MLKMQVALDELLKTKGKKSALDELMKIKGLRYFPNSIMKVKEIARKIGSAVHAKPRLERVAWRQPFHPLGTRLVPRSLRLRKGRNSREVPRTSTRTINRPSDLFASGSLSGLVEGRLSGPIQLSGL